MNIKSVFVTFNRVFFGRVAFYNIYIVASIAGSIRVFILKFLEFWGLVNNAGYVGVTSPFEFFKREDFEYMFNVNAIGKYARHVLL